MLHSFQRPLFQTHTLFWHIKHFYTPREEELVNERFEEGLQKMQVKDLTHFKKVEDFFCQHWKVKTTTEKCEADCIVHENKQQ